MIKYFVLGAIVLVVIVSFTKKLDFTIQIGMSGETYSCYVAQSGIVIIMRSTHSSGSSLKKLSYLGLNDRNAVNKAVDQLKGYEDTDTDVEGFKMSDANYYSISYGNKHHTVASGNTRRAEGKAMGEIAAVFLRMIN